MVRLVSLYGYCKSGCIFGLKGFDNASYPMRWWELAVTQ